MDPSPLGDQGGGHEGQDSPGSPCGLAPPAPATRPLHPELAGQLRTRGGGAEALRDALGKPGARDTTPSPLTSKGEKALPRSVQASGRQRLPLWLQFRTAYPCFPLPDSSRRGMSWKICRFSAARPEPRSALEPPGLAPFRRLFRFSASVDHQMTPPWFARLFRASRFRLAHWRSGCRAPLRGPSDLKHHTACGLSAGWG